MPLRSIENVQIVALPMPPGLTPIGNGFVGPHTVFISGRAVVFVQGTDDDEEWVEEDIPIIVGPTWAGGNPLPPLQVSATVALAGIVSADSDEVDHSRWEITDFSTQSSVMAGTSARRVQINVHLITQGCKNTLTNVTFHIVANGTLATPMMVVSTIIP
ncbi:MAG: hypothetical protein KDA75_07305 [Planctomycetaceae bacterium]|nr:hypothetical protein [Planctomycetaceae bacterium]